MFQTIRAGSWQRESSGGWVNRSQFQASARGEDVKLRARMLQIQRLRAEKKGGNQVLLAASISISSGKRTREGADRKTCRPVFKRCAERLPHCAPTASPSHQVIFPAQIPLSGCARSILPTAKQVIGASI
jgi:hypothetical protein